MRAFRRWRSIRSHRAPSSRKEFAMRVAGTILSLSLLVAAVPAFAQAGSYQQGDNWYSRQLINRDGYGYLSPEQQHLQSRPTYPGDWQQQSYGQNQQGPWQQGQMGPGMQGGYAPYRMGQTGQPPSAPVSPATQGQIKSSLESSGFKNVSVLPHSYLIRATAPDGAQVVMQVSSDGVYGVVVNSTDQASSSGTGGAPSTGGTSSSTGSASTDGTSGTESASTGGNRGTSDTSGTSSCTGSISTGDASGTGGTSGSTSGLSSGSTSE